MAMPRKDSGDFVLEEFVPFATWTEDSTCHCLLVRLPGFKKEWLKLQVDSYGHVLVSGGRQERKNKVIHFHQKFELPENSDVDNISGRYEGEILYVTVPKKVKEEEGWNRTAKSVEEKQEDSKEDEKGDKGITNGGEEKDSKEDEKRDKGNANGVEKKHERMKEKEQEQDKGIGNGAEEKHEQKEQRDDGNSYPREKDENTRMAHEGSREFNFLGSFMDILNKNKQVVISAVLAFSLGLLVSRKFQSNIGREDHFH